MDFLINQYSILASNQFNMKLLSKFIHGFAYSTSFIHITTRITQFQQILRKQ